MTQHVAFTPADTAHAQAVAENMRAIDRLECELTAGCRFKAARESVARSDTALAALVDDEPCAIFGVAELRRFQRHGLVWMLATPKAAINRRLFMDWSLLAFSVMRQNWRQLENQALAKNRQTLRWWRWMGGQTGAPFRSFGDHDWRPLIWRRPDV